MSDKIAIDADVMAHHIGKVNQVATSVGLATSAARSMNLGGGAFGLMCSFLVAPAVAVTSVAVSSIESVEEAIERSAKELKGAVADFDRYESDVEDHVASIGRRLDAGGR
ncbi:hypothetical protein [Demequina aurantiaca]|uniref:hypothetical protein n=1 Tax=Demequina aurantiaca TaxID=676200 RepID=UPI000784DC89|nr:hypothetical protein [Demequina aurantiaca]